MRDKYTGNTDNAICIDESAYTGVVKSALQIVQPRLFIVDVAPVPKRIQIPKRTDKAACSANDSASCIVLVLYHNGTAAINDGRDIVVGIVGANSLCFCSIQSSIVRQHAASSRE